MQLFPVIKKNSSKNLHGKIYCIKKTKTYLKSHWTWEHGLYLLQNLHTVQPHVWHEHKHGVLVLLLQLLQFGRGFDRSAGRPAKEEVYIAIISPGHRQETLCGCRTKPATHFILQSIEANAHLVKEKGSVGGKPKALTWNIRWTHSRAVQRPLEGQVLLKI